MISLLLIVLAGREGINWVLATIPFIRRLWPYSIQWKCGNLGATYKLLGVWDNLIHSSQNFTYLRFTSFKGRILPRSYLSYVRDDIWSYEDTYHHLMWWIEHFICLNSKKTYVMLDLIKIHSLHIPPPGVVQKQEIQAGSQSHLVHRLA